MRLATQTKRLITESIEKDQGAAFRKALQEVLPKMEDAYRGESDGFRSHLGFSLLGGDCAFELWLGFRWADIPKFPARILRLFNRGHLEEARFIAMFQAADIPCWYETPDGGQYRVSHCNGHSGSALDSVVKIPELEGEPAYGEFKTHNEKSFNKVVKEGVENAMHKHYVQMQLCMHKERFNYGLYGAVNKNDDNLHLEIIEYDKNTAERYLERGEKLIFTSDGAPRISNKESFYKCKFCGKKNICHQNEKPLINCRTCAHSEPLRDGTWVCTNTGEALTKDKAIKGCKEHIFNPYLMPSVKILDKDPAPYFELELESGTIIKHGPNHVTSEKLDLNI